MFFPGLGGLVAKAVDWCLNSGRAQTGQRIAATYVRLRPGDPGGWQTLVRVHSGIGQLQDAEAFARTALDRHPSSVELGCELARILVYQGELEAGLSMASTLAHDNPQHVEPLITLAAISQAKGDWTAVRNSALEAERKLHLEEDTMPLVELALAVLGVPGERDWAIRMLERAARNSRNYVAHILLHELGAPNSEEHLKKAKKYWLGSRGSFEKKRSEVGSLLEGALPKS